MRVGYNIHVVMTTPHRGANGTGLFREIGRLTTEV